MARWWNELGVARVSGAPPGGTGRRLARAARRRRTTGSAAEKGDGLPLADGPLVRVRLHDNQALFAVVKRRWKEADGTWRYDLQIHLPAATQTLGRLTDEPAPVDFRAPAARCEPIQGQPYDTVPTERHGITPNWVIEEPMYYGPDTGPARIVHRGGCRACRDQSRTATTDQARTLLHHPDTEPCQICRPDRPLKAA